MKNSTFISSSGYELPYIMLEGKTPYLVYIHGYGSSKSAIKAQFVQSVAAKTGHGFFSFDMMGHGEAGGDFGEDGSVSVWKKDVISALKFLDKDCITVGSSQGAWLMFLAAEEFPDRIKGMISVSGAPDFTDDIVSHMTEEKKKSLEDEGILTIHITDEIAITVSKNLIEHGQRNLILQRGITHPAPIVLIHGTQDKMVHYSKMFKVVNAIKSDNVKAILLKGAGHSMDNTEELHTLEIELLELLAKTTPAE